ncbi:SURF1 family cytochrome oxidase biogenesis protein [Nocardia arizonensis]|uniref:SURF1 family cytochrome oxidase biogenesis protein n=1 Tax=Nocardia arizonensis TaxID=1141647 RepID=UPI0006CFC620|nr:SURF1 family cytochrome oxidase biogenesis protein [Nocardia arizonensis]
MRRLTFLLRPSWLILAAVVVAFAYLCFTVLAPWQLGKNTATSHRNQAIADSVRADPIDVSTLFGGSGSGTEWRRVTAEGGYLPNSTVLVRLRHLDGAPGYSVLAAFKTTEGRILLVDRGLVAGVDGTARPPRIPDPPSGPQRLEGRVRVSEGVTPGREPLTQDGFRQVYSIDTTQAMTVMEIPLTAIPAGDRGGYLQLSEQQPGAFTPTPLPQLDAGPYLSYGLQWLAFGIMAPLGLGYFVYAEIRERRKEKVAAAPATPTEPTATEPANTAPRDRLADRYGRDGG